MPQNMEIKARLSKPIENIINRAANVCGTESVHILEQKDTFFGTSVDGSLLKLREEYDQTKKEKRSNLVAYTRELKVGPKHSRYVLTPVADVKSMIDALTMTNGFLGEVVKTRHVFFLTRKNLCARIHIDNVKGLGEFMEFEIMMDDDSQIMDANEYASYLCILFEIKEKDHIAGAYFSLEAGSERANTELNQGRGRTSKPARAPTES